MAFQESNRMEQRVALLRDFDLGIFSVSELCRRYGISRETFYSWKERRMSGDLAWFLDRTSAPGSCPHAMSAEVESAVLALRGRFRHFGPKKLRAKLMQAQPNHGAPSASSIGALLKRKGLIDAQCRRKVPKALGEVLDVATSPCEEWAMDFKGWFRTRDGTRCDPLTVTDTASRYLVGVQIIAPRFIDTQAVLTQLFQAHGMPQYLRSDNGSPFGSSAAGGLSKLAIWLMLHGVEPRFIPPGSPQDNGRHERMHRTLKAETSKPAADNATAQQVRFDDFQKRYNDERPHEALGQQTPSSHYQTSPRPYQLKPDAPWYDAEHQVRKVRKDGTIKWKGSLIFISETLHGQPIGLAEQENGLHIVRFMHRDLGVLDRHQKLQPYAPPRAKFKREVIARAEKST